MQQQRLDTQHLRVLRIARHAGLHTVPRIVQPAFPFIPFRQAQLRVDGDGAAATACSKQARALSKPPQPVILLAEQHQQGNILGRQFGGALAGLVRQGEIQLFACGKPQFVP